MTITSKELAIHVGRVMEDINLWARRGYYGNSARKQGHRWIFTWRAYKRTERIHNAILKDGYFKDGLDRKLRLVRE